LLDIILAQDKPLKVLCASWIIVDRARKYHLSPEIKIRRDDLMCRVQRQRAHFMLHCRTLPNKH